MSDVPSPDLISRAQRTRVAVVGGGIAGLVAAWECARVGMPVTLFEAAGRLGGTLETDTLDGIALDPVADAFPLGSATLRALIDEVGLSDRIEPAAAEAVAIASAGGSRVTTLPPNLAGIPANTWDVPVRRLVGWRGVWRAYLDRLRPPLTIGRQHSLGALVRTRMGERVRDRLVAPLSTGLYGVDPDVVDADLAVPGLNAALTRAGSLSGAVGQLLPETDGARRGTLRGGLGTLVPALADLLRDRGVELRTGASVTALHPSGAGWDLSVASDPVVEHRDEGIRAVSADVVVLACGADATRALAGEAGVRIAPPARTMRDVVTLVTDAAPGSATGPQPAIVAPVPGSSPAALITDATAMWPSVAEAAGAARRVLRVALVVDGADAPPDDVTAAVAHDAAVALLGASAVGPVRAAVRRRVRLDTPASVLGHAARRDEARAEIARRAGLVAVGAWLSGGGIAAVAADTAAEVDRMRRGVLFGSA